MKNVLITGVKGLVGDGICRHFLNHSINVYGTSRQKINSINPNFIPMKLNLNSKNDILSLNETLPIDALIHCAAKLPNPKSENENDDAYNSINVRGTENLLYWAKTAGVKIFLYISGTGVFEDSANNFEENLSNNPRSNPYHRSKANAETICQSYTNSEMRVIIFRISAPFGYVKNNSVIPKFILRAKSNQNIELWGSGNRSQIFTFTEDIGLACRLVFINKSEGIFNITGGKSIKMNELAHKIVNLTKGSHSKIIFSGNEDPEEGKSKTISIEKAKKEIGYYPKYSLEEALSKIINNNDTTFWEEA